MRESLLVQADHLVREKKYKEAIDLYKKIDCEYLVNKGIVAFNISLVEKKLAESKEKEIKEIDSEPTIESKEIIVTALEFARNSYREYLYKNNQLNSLVGKNLPRVSVVMTCFNAEDTIQESIESLLSQNYPNLEVIVCDDHSDDGSWNVLNDMARRCSGLRIIRNNHNYGTYLSKNRAIEKSTGEIILFQDSDDISHPERVLVQVLPLLENAKLMATRTKYLRYDECTGNIIPVAGLYSKFGLITVAVRKKAFSEIGFFDAVRRAGDDEWVQRMLFCYGNESMKNIDITLYLARLRSDSLVSDMISKSSDGSGVEQTSSIPRKQYVTIFKKRFEKNNKRYFYQAAFPPFPLRANMVYPETIKSLEHLSEKVCVSLCSIPSRVNFLETTLKSLEKQVDLIFLYLDKYDSVPQFILDNKKISIKRSQDEDIDYRDNAKFLAFNELKEKGQDFYYFTCDDDIEYPHDYVHTMIRALKHFDNKVIAGVHGVIVEEKPVKYFKRRFTYNFELDSLQNFRLVNNLGTGTVAFHSTVFSKIDPRIWSRGGMVDIFFSIECLKKSIPMVCIPRHADWLHSYEETKLTPTLFNEFNDKEPLIVDELRPLAPWGYSSILRTIQGIKGDLRERLNDAVPPFSDLISVTTSFPRYR